MCFQYFPPAPQEGTPEPLTLNPTNFRKVLNIFRDLDQLMRSLAFTGILSHPLC